MALVVGYASFELLLVSQVKGSNAVCTIYSVPQRGQIFYGIAYEFISNANFIIFYCNYLVRNDMWWLWYIAVAMVGWFIEIDMRF